MKVTQVALRPTEASDAAGRPSLTPELLAASGARYSRNNEGLEAILSKIDPNNLDKSVDGIFKMIDYGHQSIADMAPVAMFLDGVSMWLAYHVWSLSPTAGGQESSTRYIRLSLDNLPEADELGIPESQAAQWKQTMASAFEAYEKAVAFWEGIAAENPSVTRIPRAVLEDTSERAQKQVLRMQRNYAFDRARYFLPAALRTNVMLIQSARAWVTLCQQLLSHPLPEAQKLGGLIRDELGLAAPRLLKHAEAKKGWQGGILETLNVYRASAEGSARHLRNGSGECPPEAFLDVLLPAELRPETAGEAFAEDLEQHDNRYAFIGPRLSRTAVRFGWDAVALADIRDLNRHRTGTKWCPFVPNGFYGALDQTIQNEDLKSLVDFGRQTSLQARDLLKDGEWWYVYGTLLGTQFSFEHTTTADKFLYEAELRTGTGAHYRYAKHLHDALELWYRQFPETKGLVLEGSAEPE